MADRLEAVQDLLEHPPGPPSPLESIRRRAVALRRRRLALTAATAATMAAAIAVTVAVFAAGPHHQRLITGPSPTPSIAPTRPSTSTTTTTPQPARSATVFDRGWQSVSLETGDVQTGDFVPAAVSVAAVGKPGIVAFGDVLAGAYSNVEGGWFSPDGTHWQRIANASTIFGDTTPASSRPTRSWRGATASSP